MFLNIIFFFKNMENNEISVTELFESVYNSLIKKNKSKKIDLTKKIYVEVAEDSDWHRHRTGEMIYENASLCEFNNKQYLIALGLETVGYPADNFTCDLTAIEILEEGISETGLVRILERSSYFRKSVMHGLRNGNISLVKNNYGKKLFNLIKEKKDDMIAQKPEYNEEYIDLSNFGPVCIKTIKYKKETIKLMTSSIENILKE
jgi:hypothetical protein